MHGRCQTDDRVITALPCTPHSSCTALQPPSQKGGRAITACRSQGELPGHLRLLECVADVTNVQRRAPASPAHLAVAAAAGRRRQGRAGSAVPCLQAVWRTASREQVQRRLELTACAPVPGPPVRLQMADDREQQAAAAAAAAWQEEEEDADVGPMPPPSGADDGEEEGADVGPVLPKAKKRKAGGSGCLPGGAPPAAACPSHTSCRISGQHSSQAPLSTPTLQVLEYEAQYLGALPLSDMYERSYMHRDTGER